MEDQNIIDLFFTRQESAVSCIAEKYENYLYSISYNILHDHEDAKECVNDTYYQAWISIPPQRPLCLSAFLGKIVRNLSLNRFRKYHAQKRGLGQTDLALSELEECISNELDVELTIENMELTMHINNFLYSRKKQQRNIFIQRYWYLRPIREIAKDFGISESKTTTLLFRMRKELKQYLEKEGIVL